MNSVSPGLMAFLSGLAMQAPILLVCLAALAIIPEKLRHARPAAMWALWGFGLALALGLLLPAGQAALQGWVVSGNMPPTRIALVFAGFGILGSLLHAVVLGLLLAAILSTRPTTPIKA
jgi:hypothetical protein